MNTVSYFEIQADDLARASKFYSEIFGWKFAKDETIAEPYWRIEGAGPFGGLLKRPAPASAEMSGTNAYCCSIEVADFDTTQETILKNGGIVALPKFAVPGKCWQGYFLDTEKNVFGIFQVDPNAS